MAETKCRTCGSVDGYHVFMCPSYGSTVPPAAPVVEQGGLTADGRYQFMPSESPSLTAPVPPAAPKAALTREEYERELTNLDNEAFVCGEEDGKAFFNAADKLEASRARLLAHDAALRARAEEIEGLVAQEERAADVVNACRIESDARVSRLEGLLRSESLFMRSFGYTLAADGLDERIRKALAGEE